MVAVAVALIAPALAAARDARPGFPASLQAPGGQPVKKAPGQTMRGDHKKHFEQGKGHKSRLTEDERRELHRDLDRANREIYRK